MKRDIPSIITSLLSMLLLTIHLTGDIVRGVESGTLSNLTPVPILVLWLYGTLLFGGRRSGYIIIIVASILSSGVPIIHFKGAGVLAAAKSEYGFSFVWTLIALSITTLFSVVLSVRGLWRLRRGQASVVGQTVIE